MSNYSCGGNRMFVVTTALLILILGIHIRAVDSASPDATAHNPPRSSSSSSRTNNKYTSSIVNNVPAGALLGFDTSSSKKKSTPRTLDNDNIPNLFEPNEQRYDKFAACLAATGMTVDEFQSLSMSLHRNSQLFDKVMAQAYLYRMAAKRESKLSNIFGHNLLQRQPKQQPQDETPLPKRTKGSNTNTQAKRQNQLSSKASSSFHNKNNNPRPKNNFRFFGDKNSNNDRSSSNPQKDKNTNNNNNAVMNIVNGNNRAKLYQQQLQKQALQQQPPPSPPKKTQSPPPKPKTKKPKPPPAPPVKTRFDEFCASIAEIEDLRVAQRRKLQKALQIDQFPAGLSLADPRVSPFLSPKVRAVVDAFPLQAEEIVQKHGLKSDEFNELMKETKTNRFFRWKVESKIRQLPTKQRKAAPPAPVNLKKLSKQKRVSVEKRFHLDEPIVVTNVVNNAIPKDDDTSPL